MIYLRLAPGMSDGVFESACYVCVVLISVQEARETGDVPEVFHEVQTAAAEAATARDPQRESVRLRPGGASPQFRIRG